MRSNVGTTLLTLAVAATAALSVAAPAAYAQQPAGKIGSVVVSEPWSRATAAGSPNGAAYMTLDVDGQGADRLVAAASPIAGKVELHTHSMDDGVMRMRPVAAIEVEPGSPTVLRPGGLHVMLMGLKRPLKQGEAFPLTLRFETGGEATVQVLVQSPGAAGPAGAAQGHGHGN
jgi:copper(I)-binding protein